MQHYQVRALNAYALPSAELLCYFRCNWCRKIAAVNSRPALALFRWYGQAKVSWYHGFMELLLPKASGSFAILYSLEKMIFFRHSK